MIPAVRVLIERAEAHRYALEELARIVPGDYWQRRATGDAWTAREHLSHALSADLPMTGFVRDVVSEPGLLVFDPARALAARDEARLHAATLGLPDLLDAALQLRGELVRALGEVDVSAFGRRVEILGSARTWGQAGSFTVIEYLEQWADHDSGHAANIRAAIATTPDLSAVAYTRRMR